jgi:tRNA-Thr(GGU) m(6)t(6)A37 methyltransferase TsaA
MLSGKRSMRWKKTFMETNFNIRQIGVIRSEIKKLEDAPLFYTEGAPNAILELDPVFADGLHRMEAGDEILLITWLHLGKRDVLKVHPRADKSNPITGVFSTRSPDRPNPLGLHRVKVLRIDKNIIHIGSIETIDGTPVVDIKAVVGSSDD